MDFDAASLQPTYRVLMGVPGESRALDVASQNGIRPAIIEGARKYLAEERTDVSVLIKGLTEKHRALDGLESERLSRLKEAREEQRKADLARLRLKQRELELREEGVGELRRLLSESRKTLENLVKAIREGELTPEKTKEMKDFLADFAGKVEAEEAQLDAARAESAEARSSARGDGEKGAAGRLPDHLEEGCAVMVGGARKRGIVLRKAKKGYWLVETDSLRITVPESELSIVAPLEAPKPQVAVELAPRGEGGRTTAVFELDVRGMRLVEALETVEKQLDAASIQGLNLFSIIHGTGEGVLGKGIQEYLKKQASVGDYYFARPEEGGYGKTIVHLK
jgi:DNA mismatch repair protein MutS2